jgi:hypothetical protein
VLGHDVDGRREHVGRFGDALLRERPDGVHWKSEPLVRYADGRPFV